MNERPGVDRLREAMHRASDEEAGDVGRQAIATALAEVEQPAERYKPTEEEDRQRLNDAALGDVIEMVARHRMRLGRRVCSISDAKVIRMAHELMRSMADASGGNDSDPSFQ